MLMQQPLTKPFCIIGKTTQKSPRQTVFILKYPDYPMQAMSMFTDNVANAISKTLIAIYENCENTESWYKSWSSIIDLQNDNVRTNVITHLLPGLLRVNPQAFPFLLADCKTNLKALVILSMGQKLKLIKSLELSIRNHYWNVSYMQIAPFVWTLYKFSLAIKRTSYKIHFPNHRVKPLDGNQLNEANHQDKFISTMHQFISGKLSDCLNGKFGETVQTETRQYFTRFKTLLVSHLETQNNFQQKWEPSQSSVKFIQNSKTFSTSMSSNC